MGLGYSKVEPDRSSEVGQYLGILTGPQTPAEVKAVLVNSPRAI
jgi:hypothetical protein